MSGGFDPGTPPPYQPFDAPPVSEPGWPAPRRGRRIAAFVQRRWLGGVAVLLVLVVAIGITWFVALNGMPDDTVTSAGGDGCRSAAEQRDPGRLVDDPDRPAELTEYWRVLDEFYRRPAWKYEAYTSDTGEPGEHGAPVEPRHLQRSVAVDGDVIEFWWEDDGTVVVDGDDTWVNDDSWFWAAQCSSGFVFPEAAPSEFDCIDRTEVDGVTVLTLDNLFVERVDNDGDGVDDTEPPTPSCDDADTSMGLFIELRHRDGRLVSLMHKIRTDTHESTTEYVVADPKGIDVPLPGQRIPRWFVDLAAS